MARAASLSTSGAAEELRIQVTKLARSILGGQAMPLHFLNTDLQYADHCELVRQRSGADFIEKTYGFSSKSKRMRSTYTSRVGAMRALTEVTDGP